MGCGARVRGAAALTPTCVMNFADGGWVCSLDTDAQSVRRQALDALKKVRDGPKPVNRALAVRWLRAAVLEVALRLRDAGLETLKTDPLIDPLRKERRFEAIERELKFSSN
jgi:hypothetical protein